MSCPPSDRGWLTEMLVPASLPCIGQKVPKHISQLFQPKGDNSFSGTSAICDDSTPVPIFVVETPQEALERRIGLLKSVHESEDSWRNVVKGRDADNFCSKGEIFEI
jgi:hypothetical protein